MKKYNTILSALATLLFFVAIFWSTQATKWQEHEAIYSNHIDSLQKELDTLKIIHREVCKAIDDLPLAKPLTTIVANDKYGWRRDPFTKRKTFHNGLDMDGTYRDTIFASGNGMVEKARWNAGYGRCVVIKHADGYQTLYGHLSRIFVAVGDSVLVGQPIGRVGSTGRATGSHLHYEVLRDGKSVDPCNYLPFFEDNSCE